MKRGDTLADEGTLHIQGVTMSIIQRNTVSLMLFALIGYCSGCMSLTRDALSRNTHGAPLTGTVEVTTATLEYNRGSTHQGAYTLEITYAEKGLPKKLKTLPNPLILSSDTPLDSLAGGPFEMDDNTTPILTIRGIDNGGFFYRFTLANPSFPSRSFSMIVPGSASAYQEEFDFDVFLTALDEPVAKPTPEPKLEPNPEPGDMVHYDFSDNFRLEYYIQRKKTLPRRIAEKAHILPFTLAGDILLIPVGMVVYPVIVFQMRDVKF